ITDRDAKGIDRRRAVYRRGRRHAQDLGAGVFQKPRIATVLSAAAAVDRCRSAATVFAAGRRFADDGWPGRTGNPAAANAAQKTRQRGGLEDQLVLRRRRLKLVAPRNAVATLGGQGTF